MSTSLACLFKIPRLPNQLIFGNEIKWKIQIHVYNSLINFCAGSLDKTHHMVQNWTTGISQYTPVLFEICDPIFNKITCLKEFQKPIDLPLFELNCAVTRIRSSSVSFFSAMKHSEEINRGYKINKRLHGLLVYWWIMPLVERLSSEFQSELFIFLDNLSASGIVFQYTSPLKWFIY